MKKTILPALVAALMMTACEPMATFDQPQPADEESLAAFPGKLTGHYISKDQTSTLSIDNSSIVRTYDYDFKTHRDSLPAGYRLTNDTLTDSTDGSTEKVLVKGDTIVQHVHGTDTIFLIGKDNVLKQFKGYFFLNKKYGDSGWGVQKLSLQNGRLIIGSISEKEDIARLKTITQTTADTVSTHFTLTRKQFTTFVKEKGFGSEEVFVKIRE